MVASCSASHTLVVGDGTEKNGQDKRPSVQAVQDASEYSIGVQLADHMGDFCVGGGRDEARVDGHGVGDVEDVEKGE